MPNHLAFEISPYLLQHAHNPIDWYPWGPEALKKAHEENKPIFLSIGYAACHWCHVMAHESFEDTVIADILNQNFISIKVDREERPDLDSIYMNAVVAMTGQGGWPMSIFMTPHGEPFYGGTYFPPTRRHGMPSFPEILAAITKSWQTDRAEIQRVGRDLSRHLQESNAWASPSEYSIRADVLQQATQTLLNTYDWTSGGWGRAPRFPQPMAIEFLQMQATRGVDKALEAASHVLERMSRGGMYDVVGGGFHRYSTDDSWLVPHFEKMLYDNAQLALAYLHGYLLTGNPYFRHICTETLDYILREMTHPGGGFFSSLDADSDGEEGKFYVWTLADIQAALPDPSDRQIFFQVYPIPPNSAAEAEYILQQIGSAEQIANEAGLSIDNFLDHLGEIHSKLRRFRNRRNRPAIDDKVLVSWNALALRAFAEAARYLQRPDYLSAAQNNASFITRELYNNRRLQRSWRNGAPRHDAFLEDYAGLAIALLELYQTDPEPIWYQYAAILTDDMLTNFRDPKGGFFDTDAHQSELITRPKEIQDNATPSGNALAANLMLRMYELTGKAEYRNIAERALATNQDYMVRHPNAFAFWLQDMDFAIGSVLQVAIIGAPGPVYQEMVDYLWRKYRPRMVVAAAKEEVTTDGPELVRDRRMLQNQPTAYVCNGFTCRQPANSLEGLQKQLN